MSSTDREQSSEQPQSRRGSFAPPPVEFTPENSRHCLKQIEFYFSEFNLPYDRFLRSLSEKNDGWIPIATIATFNRMKKYRPIEKVVEILRDSKILEVSEDGENVRRREPLNLIKDKEARIEQNKRTLAVMNIPHDENTNTNELQEKLEEFFNKLSNINQVRLRRDRGKKINGIALVEFKTLEDCEKFFETYSGENEKEKESGDILSFEGRKLNVLTKKQYDLQREATRSKNFSGSGQRSRSFTGHRKNMPKLEKKEEETSEKESESAIAE